MNEMSGKGSGFIQDLGDAARKNPLSAALIGMGVLWLFAGGRTAQRVGDFARSSGLDRIPDAAGDAYDAAHSALRSGADAVKDRVTSAGGFVKDGASDALESAARYGKDYAGAAADYATSIPGSGVEIFDTVRTNLADLFKAQPLALGAIGIAIGAGIAGALPQTEIETDYLGETSNAVKARASQIAAGQTDRAIAVAKDVVEVVKNEADAQGLTLEGARTAAGDISAKVRRLVDAAGKSTSDRAGPKKR